MPLPTRKRGQSREDHASAVISTLINEGKPRDQAVAIGLKKAGLSKKDKRKKK